MRDWIPLALSGGLLLALAGMNHHLWTLPAAPAAPVVYAAARDSAPGNSAARPAAARAQPVRQPTSALPPWRLLESDDYATYAANLRGIGCPETTLRDILVADVEKLFARRIAGVESDAGEPFWTSGDERFARQREREGRVAELHEEKHALLRQLLGHDMSLDALEAIRDNGGGSAILLHLLGNLPPEQALRIFGSFLRYQQLIEAVSERAEGILLAEDFARIGELRRQFEAALAGLAGPGELEELKLRSTLVRVGNGLPMADKGVEMTGTEARELVRHVSADWSLGDLVFESDRVNWGRDLLADPVLMRRIGLLLGAERLADFVRALDGRFQPEFAFTRGKNLPKTTAINLFNARVRAEEQSAAVRADTTLTAEQRVTLLAALRAQAETVIRVELKDAWADYQVSQTAWLTNLTGLPADEAAQLPALPPLPNEAALSVPGMGVHVVVSGDTLGRIARDRGITVERLRELNGLPTDRISVGQILRVPAKAK